MVGFILARPCPRRVHWSAHWGSLGSFVFVRYIRERPWSRRVHSGAPCVLLVRWSYAGAPIGSLGSFVFIGFIRARPGGGCVLWGSLRSFGRALGFVEFIRVR